MTLGSHYTSCPHNSFGQTRHLNTTVSENMRHIVFLVALIALSPLLNRQQDMFKMQEHLQHFSATSDAVLLL